MSEVCFLFVVNTFEREHLGVMYLAACLRDKGFACGVAVASPPLLKEKLRVLTRQYRRVVVGYSLPTVFAPAFIRLNRDLKKEFDFLSLFGGPHPTFYPEMINEEGVDIVCLGEGEYATVELAQALISHSPVQRIKNFWVKEGGQVHKNELRPLVSDLSLLPFPDRGIFREGLRGNDPGNMIIMTSRGCPFSCSYCFGHVLRSLYKGYTYYGRRSVDNVLDEIRQCAQRYGVAFVSFVDSNFVMDEKWLRDFSRRYAAQIKTPFYCNVHPDSVSATSLDLLRDAGCSVIGLGVECGDERVRAEVLRRPVKDSTLAFAAQEIKRRGIKLATSNILGIPSTDIRTDLLTLEKNIRYRPDYAMTYLMSLHPGTAIHGFASARNEIDDSSAPYYNGVHWGALRKFKSPAEKRMTVNLQNLFNLFVKFPFLSPLARLLIRLPLQRLYYLSYVFFEGYVTFGYKRSRKGLFKRALIHFRSLRARRKCHECIDHYSR